MILPACSLALVLFGAATEARSPGKPDPKKHKGVVMSAGAGVLGCTGDSCRNHDALPGFRIQGFFGGNLFGFFEIGLQANWGMVFPRNLQGKNMLSLYGLDPEQAERIIAEHEQIPELEFDFSSLNVSSAKLTTLSVAPVLRAHVPPRGPVGFYAGIGFGYGLYHGKYDTMGGITKLGFHGLVIPIQGGLVFYFTRRFALELQGGYDYLFYGLMVVNHPQQRLAAPVKIVDDAVASTGANFQRDLPRFWHGTAMLRLTF